jgi:hypothetical protein
MKRVKIELQTEPHLLNRMANHPDIEPTFRADAVGRLDFSGIIHSPRVRVLMGEHGGMIFQEHMDGFWECHTMVRKEGRGRWTIAMVRECLKWIFSRTQAVEIVTRVPRGNLGALALVRAIGGVYEFTNRNGWMIDGEKIPADIYSMHISQWIREAPGLIERGQWFHKRLESEYARLGVHEKPHPDDVSHDRQVGAAVEMILGGQPMKGLIFYNRWAVVAGYMPVTLLGLNPITIDIHDSIIVVRENDFGVLSCRAGQSSVQASLESVAP